MHASWVNEGGRRKRAAKGRHTHYSPPAHAPPPSTLRARAPSSASTSGPDFIFLSPKMALHRVLEVNGSLDKSTASAKNWTNARTAGVAPLSDCRKGTHGMTGQGWG